MQLLFVHERFGALAGAEANVFLTGSELKRRGHRLGLAHGAATGKSEAGWTEVFSERFPLDGADRSAAIHSAVKTFSPDVIFLHKMFDLDVVEALAECGVPVVRMVHDHDLYCMRGYKYHYFSRRICTRPASLYCVFLCGASLARGGARFPLKWVSYAAKQREIELSRRFSRLIVASDYMRDELLRNGFAPEQIEIHAPVPNPVENYFQNSFGERNRIVYAGQIIRGKGVDVLLKSLARVRASFECWILGDGNHRAYCERLSRKLGLDDRVHFAGFVSREEIANYYRECSVAVVSSVWPEPFGAVGLEAMRCGLPVVAFDAGGIREWLIDGWNGYLVPWMDQAAFAARVEELLRDKNLARQMGENGRACADERFSFPDYISGLENLFARIAATPANPAA